MKHVRPAGRGGDTLEKAIALLQPAASLQPAKPTTAPR
jgi:hypothetical protein